MKSPQVYALLRAQIGPGLKAAGFTRAKTMLSWVRPQKGGHLLVWCQVSRDGWDDFAGSGFTVEFQLSDEPTVGARDRRRERFSKLLDTHGREDVRNIQNRIIRNLRRPPANHPLLHTADSVSAWYLTRFQEVDRPYNERDDIWLRYANEQDVIDWGHFIAEKLPGWLQRTEPWE